MANERFKVERGLLAIGNSEFQGNLTITDTLYIGNNNFEFNTNTIPISAAVNTSIDSYSANTYRFAKYFLTVRNDANTKFQSQEVLVVTSGANAFITVYGEVFNDHLMGTVDAFVVSGNVILTFTPVANVVPGVVSTYRIVQA
jgi:hypothetical protein